MQSKHFDNNAPLSCSCDWVQARLWDYLDGTLNAADRDRMQTHNHSCPTCERELQAVRSSEMALNGAVGAAPAAGDLRAGFYAKLAASEAKPHRSRGFGWTLAVPALAVGVLAVVLWRPVAEPNTSGERLLVEKPLAIAPPDAKSFVAETGSSKTIIKKSIAPVVAKILPSAVSGAPNPERLKLANATRTIRLTPQDIRQTQKVGLVRADAADWRFLTALGEAERLGFSMVDSRGEHFGESGNSAFEIRATFRARNLASDVPSLEKENITALNAVTADAAISNRTDVQRTLRQNVNKLAYTDSAASAETDNESYLEVADDTRNFSYSTRLASSQDSDGEGIELSISSDEPDADPEGAGTE